MNKRSEINSKYQWSLKVVYQSEIELEKDIEYLKKETKNIQELQGQVVANETNLLVGLNLLNNIYQTLEKIYVYASHYLDQDHGNSEAQTKMQQVKNLFTEIAGKVAFFIPELLTVEKNIIDEYIYKSEYLKEYEKFLNDVFEDYKYTLGAKEERVMSLVSNVTSGAYDIYSTLTNADLKFPSVEDKFGKDYLMDEQKWSIYATSEDGILRKSAFKSLLTTYGNLENTFTSLYVNHVQSLLFKMNVRNYDSPRQMALYNNQIDEEIYDKLIEVTNNNLDLNHDYLMIKKKLLQLEELHIIHM